MNFSLSVRIIWRLQTVLLYYIYLIKWMLKHILKEQVCLLLISDINILKNYLDLGKKWFNVKADTII